MCGRNRGIELSVGLCVALTLGFLLPTLAVAGNKPMYQVSAGMGSRVPLGGDTRERYGSDFVSSMGAAVRLEPGRGWVFVEVGYIASSGDEIGFDPTFELPNSDVTIVPVLVGLRGVLGNPSPRARAWVGGAVAGSITWVSKQGPFDDDQTASSIGLTVEIRPEARIAENWSLWVADRISLATSASFGGDRESVSIGSASLHLGLSHSWGSGETR